MPCPTCNAVALEPTALPHHHARRIAALLLLALCLTLPGCNIIRYITRVVAGDDTSKRVKVLAEYDGLKDQRVAVLVAADEFTYFDYPNSTRRLRQAVTTRLTADIEGYKPVDPDQLETFQNNNPHWTTWTYGELLKRLDVDRIVYVDLSEYTTHQSGDPYTWRGVVVANVGVASTDAPNTNNLVYRQQIKVIYPEDDPVGVVDSDDETIELGMLNIFATAVSWKFTDHEEVVRSGTK